jgi:hypothetical protein
MAAWLPKNHSQNKCACPLWPALSPAKQVVYAITYKRKRLFWWLGDSGWGLGKAVSYWLFPDSYRGLAKMWSIITGFNNSECQAKKDYTLSIHALLLPESFRDFDGLPASPIQD